MQDGRRSRAYGRSDAHEEHVEEERERYRELLEELRTVMPGVQVLFGFLLVAPFSARFAELDDVGKWAFAFALVTAALATVVFVAPAPYHRLRGQRHRDERLATSVRLQLVGISLLGLATVGAVFVVTRFFLGTAAGLLLGGLIAVAVLAFWFGLPLARRR